MCVIRIFYVLWLPTLYCRMTAEPTATKTLEATLAPPTAHKERRLHRTVATYRRALEDAFESGADTQSAVNDVVTPSTLTSYAKDALKSYVPKLGDTYDASELEDDHPVRFTNRGFRLDHSDDRRHKFCWRVPQAGRGNAFWIPLRINPEQRELWTDLFDGDLSAGEFRLQQNRTNWVLHVTVEYEIEAAEMPVDPTPVGFDIGESKLLTGCALTDNGTPKEPFMFDGSRARHLRKEMHTTSNACKNAKPLSGDVMNASTTTRTHSLILSRKRLDRLLSTLNSSMIQ